MHLVIVVVLYHEDAGSSRTLRTLRSNSLEGLNGLIYVWDNSPTDAARTSVEALEVPDFEIRYDWHPENTPLPAVYNSVADSTIEYMIILDQDSGLPSNFLQLMKRAAEAHPDIKLFLPKVHNGAKLVSPGRLLLFKGKHLPSIDSGVALSRGLLAITSGMMLAGDLARAIRFDQRLTLYGADTRFMLDFSERYDRLFIVETSISHNTALWSESEPEKLIPRYRSLVSSWPIVFERRPAARLLSSLYARYFAVRMAIKHRNLRFLSIN